VNLINLHLQAMDLLNWKEIRASEESMLNNNHVKIIVQELAPIVTII